jgi:hypothetical protein
VQVSPRFIPRNRVWEDRGVHVFSFSLQFKKTVLLKKQHIKKAVKKIVVRITKKE